MIRRMFCHKCGTQVSSDTQYCTTCGASLAVGGYCLEGANAAAWTAPAPAEVRSGHWNSEGWGLVTADLGNYVPLALAFAVLSGASAPILQGAVSAGLHF